jgi:hypothetical protein
MSATLRHTVVCRNLVPTRDPKEPKSCGGGGWWGDAIPNRCPKCKGRLTDLAVTVVVPIRESAT